MQGNRIQARPSTRARARQVKVVRREARGPGGQAALALGGRRGGAQLVHGAQVQQKRLAQVRLRPRLQPALQALRTPQLS